MERSQQRIKPLLKRHIRINSAFISRNFIKKGYHTFQKLALRFEDNDPETPRHQRVFKKAKLLRVFKRIKFTRDLDLNRLLVSDLHFYFPACLYIAKKMAHASYLSVYDVKRPETNYKGLVTTWPKYMKGLKSLSYQISVELSNPIRAILGNVRAGSSIVELIKNVKMCSHYIKYLAKLEIFKVEFPGTSYSSALDSLWKFEKYPVSIKKIAFNSAKYREKALETSLAHLKNLKNLKIDLFGHYYGETIKSLFEILPSQLEALVLNIQAGLDFGAISVLKKLDKLKKVKLRIKSSDENNNLKRLLESFEECPLEEFHLDHKMAVKCDKEKDISLIKDFVIKKRNLIKTLKIDIKYLEEFKSFGEIAELFKIIADLPQLTSLSFSARITSRTFVKTEVHGKISSLFEKLLSNGLKKFAIAFNEFIFPKDELFKLLESVQSASSTLEKLQIDIGGQDVNESNLMISFLRNLKNIRILKLLSLDIKAESFFVELIETIETLKCLRTFSVGQVFKVMTTQTFVNCIERIMLKPGLEEFFCEVAADLRKLLFEKNGYCPLNLERILQKNVYFAALSPLPIFSGFDMNKVWEEKL